MVHNKDTRVSRAGRGFQRGAAFGLGLSVVAAGAFVAPAAFAADETTPEDVAGIPLEIVPEGSETPAPEWTPDIVKNVLGAKIESGPNADKSIEGLGVWPGQSAKYEILVDRDLPTVLGGQTETDDEAEVTPQAVTAVNTDEQPVIGFEVHDQLPAGVTPDLKTLSVFDPSLGETGTNLASGADYTASVTEDGVLVVAFTPAWIEENVGETNTARLSITFTATLAEDAAPYTSVENSASQVITLLNVQDAQATFSRTSSAGAREERTVDLPGETVDDHTEYPDTTGVVDAIETVKKGLPNGFELETTAYEFSSDAATVLVPGVEPEAVLADTEGVEVEDRVAVGGDSVVQSVTLDGTFGEDAAPDEWSEEGPVALDLAYDVTRFGIVDDFDEKLVTVSNVRVLNADGADVTDFFTVSTKGGVLEVLAKVDTQGKVPVDVLGQDYTVEYHQTVRADISKDATITADLVEVVDDREHPIENPSFRAVAVSPAKSAVAENGSREAIGEVASGGEFWYRTVSSLHPANALYPVTSWATIDAVTGGDQPLHDAWSVRAVGDILDANGEVLFADGDVIADQATNAGWFSLRFQGNQWHAEASADFLSTVSAGQADEGNAAAQWELFVSATRVADEGTRTSNTLTELRNSVERDATVTTGTAAAVVDEEPTPEPEPSEEPTPEPEPSEEPTPEPEPSEEPTPEPEQPSDGSDNGSDNGSDGGEKPTPEEPNDGSDDGSDGSGTEQPGTDDGGNTDGGSDGTPGTEEPGGSDDTDGKDDGSTVEPDDEAPAVAPELTVSPATLEEGADVTVTISGKGYSPDALATIQIQVNGDVEIDQETAAELAKQGDEVKVFTKLEELADAKGLVSLALPVQTDADGAFSVDVPTKGFLAGTYDVETVDEKTDLKDSGSFEIVKVKADDGNGGGSDKNDTVAPASTDDKPSLVATDGQIDGGVFTGAALLLALGAVAGFFGLRRRPKTDGAA